MHSVDEDDEFCSVDLQFDRTETNFFIKKNTKVIEKVQVRFDVPN
jgi:hypothetical protein